MNSKKILIVEDEMTAAVALEIELHERGYTTCPIAVSSESAMELAVRETPDLVLMDIGIYGKMSGIQTAKVIQEVYKIPIIFITGDCDEATVEKANAVNHAGYIVKPINLEHLFEMMETALGADPTRENV